MAAFIEHYFGKTAPHALKRTYPIIAGLHLNEMPRDLPYALKDRILDRLANVPLNRYPEPYAQSLVAKLADWYGCTPQQLLVGPGSSAFIRLLLTYFGLHMAGRLVITRPSFAYYEQFCSAFGIRYDTWELDSNFQYDPSLLNDLPPYSVVCLTSPNNPTGNLLTVEQMDGLLTRHPTSLFVVDEAYAEFTDQEMLPLLISHSNILLLRTMSKAFGAAGIRCGALIGPEALIDAVAGLQTPWQLTPFTIEAAKITLDYSGETNWIEGRVRELVTEREKLFYNGTKLAGRLFTIYPSHGNFLLFKATTQRAHTALLAACAGYHIRVEDLDKKPRLAKCIRITIGTPEENRFFFSALEQTVENLSQPVPTG